MRKLTQYFEAVVADSVPGVQAPVDTVEEQAEHWRGERDEEE